jgi:hypothetical protein
MLLRESSEKIGQKVDLAATVGSAGDGGIEHGAELVRFGEAVTRGNDDVDASREALRAALGDTAFIQAASIVGIFNGLVRTADFSGIPLDRGTLDGTESLRVELGLNEFAGAANTDLNSADPTRAHTGGVLGAPVPRGE